MGLFDRFPFKEKPNTACITCAHVLEDKLPILYVSHDAEDGCWQFLCGEDHDVEDARIGALEEIYEIDKSIKKVAGLEFGKSAYRKDKNSEWNVL